MMRVEEIAKNLGGSWHSGKGSAPCPVCQPERRRDQRALSLTDSGDGKLLVNCFKQNCNYDSIMQAAGLGGELRGFESKRLILPRHSKTKATADRSDHAKRLWDEAEDITGSLAERYLRKRGITCPLPPTLRYVQDCWHASRQHHPALLAIVQGGDGFAVHRTYLCPNGTGKAPVSPAKAMLGRVTGGAVRVAEAAGPLIVAEGVETALSVASGLLQKPATVYAALSTSGMVALNLPEQPGHLIVASDGDPAGRSAAHQLATRAYGLAWDVSLMCAPEGLDWNDVLQARGAAA